MRGRPPRFRDFQRQYRMIVMALRIAGNQRYTWMKNSRSLFVNLDATARLALQHGQLLPERGILRLKSALGVEE
jgi:hypothetical protein